MDFTSKIILKDPIKWYLLHTQKKKVHKYNNKNLNYGKMFFNYLT